MWPGMRPATGWIAYLTSTPLLLEHVRELTDVVLRLRDRHAVAGRDDHLAREGELHRDVLGRRRAHGAAVVGRAAGSRAGLHLAEGAEEDVRDGAVHRLRHQQRQQRPGGADEHPRDDEHGRVEDEAGRRGGEARERVQERDDDRHVRAADREHEHHAEEQSERDERVQHPLLLDACDGRDRRAPTPRRARRCSRSSGPGRRSAAR